MQRPEEASNTLKLQLETAVSYHVDARKLSPGLLEEHPVLLPAELSLAPVDFYLIYLPAILNFVAELSFGF